MKITFSLLLPFSVFLGFAPLDAVPTDASEVNPVEVGSTAPDVTLTRADGSPVRLQDLVADQPAVLVFYRGGWCPYCNRHLSDLGQVEDELRDLGYRIHAVSPDKPEKVAEKATDGEVDYSLYSDSSAEAARAFGLAFRVDAETYETLLGYGIDLEAASGEDHHLLPVPAVFLIGRDGTIDLRYYNPDYKERLSGEALLEAARNARN
jgi:peroxiredoxin